MPESFLKIASAAPVGVLAISRDGAIRLTNPALCGIFGYSEARLRGQPISLLFPDLPAPPADVFAEWAARSGASLTGRHQDGRLIPLEVGLGSWDDGTADLAVAFVNDISARQSSEARFSAIISALPAGLVMTDSTGRLVLTNPALDDMFGYAPGALAGQALEVLLPLRSRAGHPALREGYMHAPDKRAMGAGRDLMALHSTGKEFPVEVALTPLAQEGGTNVLAIVTDISVRKKLEHELRLANTKLEEFTYIVSHDLRSPLRGIADLLEWIEEDIAPAALTPPLVNNFSRAKQRINRVERMIEDLLAYARSSTRYPRTEFVNPRRLIAEVVAMIQVPPRFALRIDAPDLEFKTYKIPLQTGLMNMIDNAMKHHGGSTGNIAITVREQGRFFIFSVDDDGPGVPELSREKIFKLFHRASGNTEGHGIGLSVTKRMITSHGGELILEKHSELGGACFAIYWPRFEIKETA